MDEFLSIHAPFFARFIDYSGLWIVEPFSANQILQSLSSLDLKAHVDHGAEPLKSALEKIPTAGAGSKAIAMVRLTGLLMKSQSSMGGTSTIQARRDIRQAAADPDVGAILLAIDSPGGTVAGTDDLAAEIRAARAAKPVWAHIEDLGASAAYWAASQASRITANSPTALAGSIGTVQRIEDNSAANEKDGRRTLTFATGPLKAIGGGSKVTDEQAAHIQSLVESVQGSFDAAVKKGRNLSSEQLQAVRHGGVMTATKAMDAGLIDGIQPLGKTLAEMAREIKSSGAARSQAMNDIGVLPMLVRG